MDHVPPHLKSLISQLDLVGPEPHNLPTDPGTDDASLADLTDLPFVTIDNVDSRDLDQALYIERLDDRYRVVYAIADAAYFVRPNTPLFEHALRNGTSFYFPGFAVPMLPRTLSEGIVSLNEAVQRRALAFDTILGASGEVVETKIYRARIESRRKLSYLGVQQWFDDGATGDEPWADSLRALREVGELRAARAVARGVIEYDRTEAHIEYDEAAGRYLVRRRERNDVERWNEQLSLLCNTEGARLIADADLEGLQSVYRVHLPPMKRRLAELAQEIDEVRTRHNLDDRWVWDRDTSLAEYLRGLPEQPWRVRRAIELQVRYTNRASEYTDRVGPHFALAVEQYARFSAPMREVVGIFTHKEALEALGLEQNGNGAQDEALRERVIDAANRAKSVQKTIDKEIMLRAITDLLEADLAAPVEARTWRSGTVIVVRKTRVYVLLDELPIELKLYAEDLAPVHGEFDLRGHTLEEQSGALSFGLGDGVSLRVSGYDTGRRRFKFDVSPISPNSGLG